MHTDNVIPYSGKTFEGENFHKFRGSDEIRESFLHENGCGPLCIISGRW